MARSIWTGAICFGLVTVPGQALQRGQPQDRALPPAQRQVRRRGSRRSASTLDGRRGRLRRDRQGLRALAGPLRGHRARRARRRSSPRRPRPSRSRTSSSSRRSTRSSTTTPTTWRRAPAAQSPTGCCVEAMRETDRVAIARVVIRSKEALVALRPMDDHVLGCRRCSSPTRSSTPTASTRSPPRPTSRSPSASSTSPSSSSSRWPATVRGRPSTTTPTARRSSTSSSARRPARRSPCSRRPTRRRSRSPTSWRR